MDALLLLTPAATAAGTNWATQVYVPIDDDDLCARVTGTNFLSHLGNGELLRHVHGEVETPAATKILLSIALKPIINDFV